MAKTILIVEDDPKNLTLFRDVLQVSGYKTIEATDGEQGIELAKKYKPALILLDIMMPGMNGYDVLHFIRQQYNIPVIMPS